MGDRLRKARELAGYDRQEFAKVVGIHRDSLAKYESDTQPIKRPVLVAWALASDVDVSWLEGGPNPDDGGSSEIPSEITFRLLATRRHLSALPSHRELELDIAS